MPFYIQYLLKPKDDISGLSDYLNDSATSDLGYDIDGSDDDKGLVCIFSKDLDQGKQWAENALDSNGLTVSKCTHKEISDERFESLQQDQ